MHSEAISKLNHPRIVGAAGRATACMFDLKNERTDSNQQANSIVPNQAKMCCVNVVA